MCRHCRARRNCTSASRTARSATSCSCAATACTARGSAFSEMARPSPSDVALGNIRSALPQLPLGERRLLQRLLHPPHRPALLDEGRLAGQGPGASAAATTAPDKLRRSELRQLLRRIHLRGRREVLLRRPLHGRRAPDSTPATSTAPRARRSSPKHGDLRRTLQASTRARTTDAEHASVAIHRQEQPLPERVERSRSTRSATTSPTTK